MNRKFWRAAEKASVPVVMHLDHGNSFDLAMRALRAGYTSIMIDGSHKSFEDNIAVSKAVVSSCHPSGIPVEAELGKVGGKEDDLDGGDGDPYTNPAEAKAFVEATGADSLAVAIGTAHGVYKGEPKLDLERLSEIRKVVSIPLVLHGTSGVPDNTVQECIQRGICKVNYATDLRIAFSKGVNAVLHEHPETIDPKKYNAQGRENVKQYVADKIRVCDSVGLLTKQPTFNIRQLAGKKKDASWRHHNHFIILLRFKALAERRQWSSATPKPRRKTRVRLCPHF